MNRREFLNASGLAAFTIALKSSLATGKSGPPRILLRSSWQTVNIGDIAHTPGVLNILRKHLPEAEVTLWPSYVDNGVEELLCKEFPRLKLARSGSEALARAFKDCDFLLHGSGPSIVAEQDIVRWQKKTGKPYGIYGITFSKKHSTSVHATGEEALKHSVKVLSQARFVFFRDSKSLELARVLGARSPVMEFGPDGAFGCDLRDPVKAEAFLARNGLEKGEYLCCIPRLRYTPYWTIKANVEFDPVKHARNESMKEHDHAPLREAIIEVVEQTDLKVLICPEDRTQMAVGKEMLYDRLPGKILNRVAWRPDYWLTGEAISVYVRSAGLFGNEMHSPILCIGHGVPAVVCRFAEQTSKGFMWNDIGLDDWLFDHDLPRDQERIVRAVLDIAKHPEIARDKAVRAKTFVENRQKVTMEVLQMALCS
jgi:polysaccharide pyruvyl transferase WcaK-like protein